jgi:UDP-glucose 4-epimerase
MVKTLEEEMARQFCRWVPDLKLTGLRFSNVMDPDDYAGFGGFQHDPRLRRWNLWAYVDGRDGAQAVRRALELDMVGADVFIIANADTVMPRLSAELAAAEFPDVPVQHALGEHETAALHRKARRILGFVVAARQAGDAGPESRCPWWRRNERAAPSSSTAR